VLSVSVGQVVKAGQQIARAASSGNSFGPHLHFQVERPIGGDHGVTNAGQCD
jgi:murein DD-endopeptidase MepM/ murein hydrolase activator NlpD